MKKEQRWLVHLDAWFDDVLSDNSNHEEPFETNKSIRFKQNPLTAYSDCYFAENILRYTHDFL